MLVTATFLAPRGASAANAAQQAERLLVPRNLVQSSGERPFVWLVDGASRARLRSIELGQAGTSELVEVVAGLTPTDKLIASPVMGIVDGQRVSISDETAPSEQRATP
jgi:hypothetical protein